MGDSVKTTPLPPRRGTRWAVVVVSGLLVLLAQSLPGAAAGNSAGALDPSFGNGGIWLTHSHEGEGAAGLAEDGHGRLIAVGTTNSEEFAIRRYRSNGAPDTSFGDNGEVRSEFEGGAAARAAVVQPNGKILVGGGAEAALALVRYDEAGKVDGSFGRRGHVLTPGGIEGASALDLAVGPSGRILLAGYGINSRHRKTGMLVGYRSDGTIDRSFAKQGMLKIQAPDKRPVEISGVEVLASGRILLGGTFAGRLMLLRLLPNGKPDRSFGGGDGRVLFNPNGAGQCSCSFANSLAVAPGGKPLLAGGISGTGLESGLLVRFLPNGRPDASFGRGGVVRTLRGSRLVDYAVAVGPNGRITTAGFYETSQSAHTKLAVLRYRPSGELDSSFGRSGFFSRHLGHLSLARAALAQPDGRVVVAGRAVFAGSAPAESESTLDGAQFMLMRFAG